MIIEKMKFEAGKSSGVGGTLPNFKGQTTGRGLGYKSDKDKTKTRKKWLKLTECFVKAI